MTQFEQRLTALVGPLLAELSPAERPAAIALAERIAASRYRGWAEQVEAAETRAALLACAEREEEIASRVEALVPKAADVQARLSAAHPDLPERYAALFADQGLPEQFALQASAERVGADTWRALAGSADGAAREVFLACAGLEEQSAAVLESLAR